MVVQPHGDGTSTDGEWLSRPGSGSEDVFADGDDTAFHYVRPHDFLPVVKHPLTHSLHVATTLVDMCAVACGLWGLCWPCGLRLAGWQGSDVDLGDPSSPVTPGASACDHPGGTRSC
jgi:hypothetical protein